MKAMSSQGDNPSVNMEGWNHLLEANMKSERWRVCGIKTHYLKMIALAFSRWKCFSACVFAVSRERKNFLSNDSIELNDENNLRRNQILKNAQKVILSPSLQAIQNKKTTFGRSDVVRSTSPASICGASGGSFAV